LLVSTLALNYGCCSDEMRRETDVGTGVGMSGLDLVEARPKQQVRFL